MSYGEIKITNWLQTDCRNIGHSLPIWAEVVRDKIFGQSDSVSEMIMVPVIKKERCTGTFVNLGGLLKLDTLTIHADLISVPL